MIKRLLVLAGLLVTTSALADSPKPAEIPADPIAKKKELLFSDDFESAEPDQRWHRAVATFTFEEGALKGTQTRVKEEFGKDGKVIKPHSAVHGLAVPTKDSVIEVKMRFDGCTLMDVEFDDRQYTGSHYGHLCRAQVMLDKVRILDERDGTQNEEIKALREDPSKKEEVAKRMEGKVVTFPVSLEQNKTYTVVVETVGDAMRVSIDGKPVAYHKSPGIGHPTKSQIEIGVAGQSGWFDDLKVWNAEPAN